MSVDYKAGFAAGAKGGPFLIVAAFWCPTDIAEQVVEVLRVAEFDKVPGRSGSVCSYRDAVASAADFQYTMRRLQLSEVNWR